MPYSCGMGKMSMGGNPLPHRLPALLCALLMALLFAPAASGEDNAEQNVFVAPTLPPDAVSYTHIRPSAR